MLTGRKPSALAETAMDIALILHADHELNASTFAARVTAATLSDMYSACRVGRSGPSRAPARRRERRRHADAARDRRVGRAETVDQDRELAQKQGSRGSAIASTTPRTRARPTCGAVARARAAGGCSRSGSRCRAHRGVVNAEKKLHANVDFYSASTYHSMGIDPISSHRSSWSPASPGGRLTSWSSRPTTASSGRAPSTRGRARRRTSPSASADRIRSHPMCRAWSVRQPDALAAAPDPALPPPVVHE